MFNYNYDSLTETAKSVISEAEFVQTVNRVYNTLIDFSDHPEKNFDKNYIARNLKMWANNKAEKIAVMKSSPLYNEENPWKLIHEATLTREPNFDAVRRLARQACIFGNWTMYSEIISMVSAPTLSDTDISAIKRYIDEYTRGEGKHTLAGAKFYDAPSTYYDAVAPDDVQEQIKKETAAIKDISIREGMKTSRFIRNLLTTAGYKFVKKDDYTGENGTLSEKTFAEFADGINPTTFKRQMILSLDPVDYLLMSHGNSWASCYTINGDSGSDSYSGCYSAGTWSYMGDCVTFIMYVVSENVTSEFATMGKINRQCVMFDDKSTIAHSRIYPQGNDANSIIYKEFRKYGQQFISELYDLPNYWEVKKNCYGDYFVASDDYMGYNDLEEFESVVTYSVNITDTVNKTVDAPIQDSAESEGKRVIKIMPKAQVVGEYAFCPVCGEYLNNHRYLCEDCDTDDITCECCGREIDRDDAYCIDGEYYCWDCTFYCDYHGEREVRDDVYYVHGYGDVCYDGLMELEDEGRVDQCIECDEYYLIDDLVETPDGFVCEYHFNRYYTTCPKCGEIIRKNDENFVEFDNDGNRIYMCESCRESLEEENEENA